MNVALSQKTGDTTHVTHTDVRPALTRLALFACGIEVCCLLIVALSPLPSLRLNDTPLTAWTWLLTPAHWLSDQVRASELWLAPSLLALVFTGLLAFYGIAIRVLLRSLRDEQQRTSQVLLLLLGSTFLFGVTLLFQPRLFSDDVFTYIISGRILTIYHANPLNTAPIHFAHDPYLRWVIAGRYAPNIYGPLWYCVCWFLSSLNAGPVGTLLLFKSLGLCAHLLNGLLVWYVLRTVAPTRRMLGTLLYLWNPLILLELAGGGHNEGLLLTLLLAATLLYTWRPASALQGTHAAHYRGQQWMRLGAMLLFGVAVGMNLIVLLIVPLLAWFDVRGTRWLTPAFVGALWRVLVMLLPALALWLPFWRGASSFFALTSAVDMEHFVHAPLDLLTSTMLVLSGTALFFYVFAASVFQTIVITRYEPAIIFGLPLVYLLVMSYRARRRRIRTTGDEVREYEEENKHKKSIQKG